MANVPGKPTDLAAALEPTTGAVSWKPPTDNGGVPVAHYEISYAEGATPGNAWKSTGGTDTRFFLAALKRGTQYAFRVRAVNEAGAGAASDAITARTPIASLHNTIFFKECLNYAEGGVRVSVHGNPANLVRAAADNDYNTFTTQKDLDINMAVDGKPSRVDAVFVKGIGIDAHTATPSGGDGSGYSNRLIPATVTNYEGTPVNTSVYGFQHDLYLLPAHFTATSVRFQFTGTDAKLHAVMLLQFGLELDANADFTEIALDMVDRSGVIHETPAGGLLRSRTIGNERPKWEVNYILKVIAGKTLLQSVEDLLYWCAENPNIVHAQEPSRHPGRVYPASFLLTRVPVRLRTDNKLDGEVVEMTVAER